MFHCLWQKLPAHRKVYFRANCHALHSLDENQTPTDSKHMKTLFHLAKLLSALAVLTIVTSCATTQQTENLLSAAGFKTVIASTAKQQNHLATLAPGKITAVQKKGTTYFVFPDARHNQMFVGTQAQYTAYQNLRLKQQLSNEKMMTAAMNEDAAQSWNTWGPVWGPAWGY